MEDLPLRWGSRVPRIIAGAVLIVSGGVAVAGSNSISIWWLLVPGTLAHIAGWCVIPSVGWRRVVAVLMSTPSVWVLLTGPRFIAILLLPYLGWLLVRHQPLRSYPTVTFVLAGAIILAGLYPNYDGMLPALAIEAAVIFASAWAASAVARPRNSRRLPEQAP